MIKWCIDAQPLSRSGDSRMVAREPRMGARVPPAVHDEQEKEAIDTGGLEGKWPPRI